MSALHAVLDMTLDGLGDLAKADMVTGKPVQIQGKTIIPVLALSVSMGGGGGAGKGEGTGKQPQGGTGVGGMAGGGAQLIPAAIIVKDNSGVRILKVPREKKGLEKLLEQIPSLVERIKNVE